MEVIKTIISDDSFNEPAIWLKIRQDSSYSLQFEIKYNFIRLLFAEFYSEQKYHFFGIENRKFAVTKSDISRYPFSVSAIWLKMLQVQTII